MRIFIAGASGAIGLPLLSFLLDEGHHVFGMTQSKERAQLLLERGVTPIIADALDKDSIHTVIKACKPEVVINMLTALPKVNAPELRKATSARNELVRREGGENIQAAAISAGVRRCIIQSSSFWYEKGVGLADEADGLAVHGSPPSVAEGSRLYVAQEKHLFDAQKEIEGVSLRFGFFYGPRTWWALDASNADQVRAQKMPIIGGGEGVWNFVHIEDAALAIVKALNCPTGIYNINDDFPIEMRKWLPAYARWLGASPPLHISEEEAMHLYGPDAVYYAMHLRGASNAKAKKVLEFNPRPLEWLN